MNLPRSAGSFGSFSNLPFFVDQSGSTPGILTPSQSSSQLPIVPPLLTPSSSWSSFPLQSPKVNESVSTLPINIPDEQLQKAQTIYFGNILAKLGKSLLKKKKKIFFFFFFFLQIIIIYMMKSKDPNLLPDGSSSVLAAPSASNSGNQQTTSGDNTFESNKIALAIEVLYYNAHWLGHSPDALSRTTAPPCGTIRAAVRRPLGRGPPSCRSYPPHRSHNFCNSRRNRSSSQSFRLQRSRKQRAAPKFQKPL